MDWAADARAVLHTSLGGQEMAAGLADVLLGDAEPAGRLPTTIPLRLEHNPSFGNFPGENGHVRYGEGVLVGYRWYEARRLPVRFPFGHGGSYTTFRLGEPALSATTFAPGRPPVGPGGGHQHRRPPRRRGRAVLRRPARRPASSGRPRSWPGSARCGSTPARRPRSRSTLDERAFAYWDPGLPERAELAARATAVPMAGGRGEGARRAGGSTRARYELHVGTSSAAIAHVAAVEVTAPTGA